MNINTVKYWHKLEHFYPYILEEQRDKNITTFSVKEASDFPDYNDQDIPVNMQIRYYEIYLGIFKVDSALKVLAEKMNAEKEFRDESDETSCFCKIRVEPNGTFNKESFKISSFPWAIHRVKDGGIEMEQWDEAFHEFQRTFFLRIFNCHEILTYEILRDILCEIKNSINWDIKFEECWMRIDRVIGEKQNYSGCQVQDASGDNEIHKTDAEIQLENKRVDELIKANDLLNSFYVRDLERILEHIKNGNYGDSLNSFVDHAEGKRADVEKDKEELFKIFSPKYLPLGKWPSGYGLRGMQQVAVNVALSDLCANNIFSVNGPPGTGKTTLLRDIIAAKEVERAIKLLSLEKPDEAFAEAIGEFENNGFKSTVKPLKPEFSDYGILIASNNNSAVKNITDELPLKSSISEVYRENYKYFPEVSNRLHKEETWGIVSATLGNYANRSKFINKFWPVFDEEENVFKFHEYLKGLKKGRNDSYYKNNWKNAKERFEKIYFKVKSVYAEMQNCYDKVARMREINDLLVISSKKIQALLNGQTEKEAAIKMLEIKIDENRKLLLRKEEMKEDIKRNTAFFTIKYLFFKKSLTDYRQLEKDIQCLIIEKGNFYEQVEKLEIALNKIVKEIKEAEQNYRGLIEEQSICEKSIRGWSETYQSIVPDEEYLSNLVKEEGKEREKAQNVAPWNGKQIIELREKLYLEAVELHRVFVENSPELCKQLEIFYKMICNKIPKDNAMEFATPIMQSFQMVVPVISSTFASIGSFLKYMGRNTFGLLLIDEAGQALPQSAVGAIWRAEKSVIVGDPLQIDPVVTIHDKTMQFLKLYFNQSDFIASKVTSVQSLADNCNKYGGWRFYEDKEMWIGSPLLVHGRCQRPIFNIANIIAYNGKMIYGTKDVENVECRWEHVTGNAVNKHFVKEQASAIAFQVVNAFREALSEGKDAPSLFIITPFRSVKAGLTQYFSNNDYLYTQIYRGDDKEKKEMVKDWIYKNIGTIHTFQGKEADRVIIVLGVDSGDRGYGAIQWASQKPNILNVAVTRAKKQLCIVGDKNKWAKQPYFKLAYDICNSTGSDV